MRAGGQRGFTLLELIIALAIVGSLLVVAFGGLRVALAAWTRGEDRAEAHQHVRSVAVVLSRAVAGAYPSRAPLGEAPEPVILFRGEADRLEFVTRSPAVPAAVPAAFTAVVLGIETEEEAGGLVVRQRVMPNRDPFSEAAVVLRDGGVQQLRFQYLDERGAWRDQWDAQAEGELPRAVRIEVGTGRESGPGVRIPLTVALHVVRP